MAQFRTNRVFDIILLVALAAGLGWAALNRTAVGDWFFFLNYHPSPQAVTVAADASLTAEGRRLLYRTNPQFVTKPEIDEQCGAARLGCLTPKNQAYILDDPTKLNQSTVTASHEMLHLAYQRLSQSRRDELAPLIDQAIALNKSAKLEDELGPDADAADRRDEAHSLLGTEYKNLPAALETYYQTYFTDRSAILRADSAN